MKRPILHSRTLNLPTLSLLLIVFLLSACAPAASTPVATKTSTPVQPAAPLATATVEVQKTVPALTVTSRGPNLVATDPSTVSLASGQLQLVEFFRFT
ncbi:MAG: hypothetical protein AB1531_01525 [Chloroflexota bacterium]